MAFKILLNAEENLSQFFVLLWYSHVLNSVWYENENFIGWNVNKYWSMKIVIYTILSFV